MNRAVDVLAMGEPLVELNAAGDGGLEDVTTFHRGFGGDTSNVAVAASRMGATAGYLTRVGDDAFGAALLALWAAEGVDTSTVVKEPGGRTGIYFIDRDERASSFTYYRDGSAASRITPEDVPADAVRDAAVLHVSGISQAISTSACDATFHAMGIAREAGTLVSYDANIRPALWPATRAHAVVRHGLRLADIALPNIEEARQLTDRTLPEEVLRAVAALGPSLVVLKLGEEGALLWDDGDVHLIPPHPVDPVDSTGAGDTFDGAFLARLTAGDPALRAAEQAAVAAALTTTGAGAVGPIPRLATVRARLSEPQRTP